MKDSLRRGAVALYALAVATLAGAKVWTYETVPNTRLQSNEIHVANPDGILSAATEDSINAVCASVRSRADVFVVVLDSIDSADEADFATRLFAHWGIGDSRERSNGVLLLMVRSTHYFRIEPGYGMEGALTDALCSQIARHEAFPRFWQDDLDGGMLAATKGVVRGIEADNVDEALDYYQQDDDDDSVTDALTGLGVGLGIGGLGLGGYWVVRRRPRRCPVCGRKMRCLSEKEEDEFLSEVQQSEEKFNAKDYDVWLCEGCHHTQVLDYTATRTAHFRTCESCGARLSEAVDTVITRYPTQYREGSQRVTYRCRHCGAEYSITQALARKTDAVVIGGGFGGGGGGFSGGSFGGGMSGGGGFGG
ncbi:MAG: TPM domain-containing protein, partial [Bacteroidaceae bacterium]|nr:TPM domain-containing protein [Bacteroidaceae bacterium]